MLSKFFVLLIVTVFNISLVTSIARGVEHTRVAETDFEGSMLAKGYTAVPLYKTVYGAYIVRIRICNVDYNFMIDTGAACDLSIDSGAFKRITKKLDLREAAPIKGIGSKLVKSSDCYIDGTSFVDANYNVLGLNILSVTSDFSTTVESIHPKTGKTQRVPLDGLLGNDFMSRESAIIDHGACKLYLIPTHKKEWPKLVGRWQCTRCTKKGNTVSDADKKQIEFTDDNVFKMNLLDVNHTGIALLHDIPSIRLIMMWEMQGKDEKRAKQIGAGKLTIVGDTLMVTFIEGDFEARQLDFEEESGARTRYEFKRTVSGKPNANAPTISEVLLNLHYVHIPLYKTVYGGFVTKVKVSDTNYILAIDTGAASQLTLDKVSFNRLTVKPELYNEGFVRGISNELVKCQTCYVRNVIFTDSSYTPIEYNLAQVLPGIAMQTTLIHPKTGKSEHVTIEGLIGQQFFLSHSAIIDYNTNALFFIPLVYKDGSKLIGRWQCTGSERDGKLLWDNDKKWFEIRNDGTAEFQLGDVKLSGEIHLVKYIDQRLITAWKSETEPTKARTHLGGGSYQLDGDKLKMIFLESDTKTLQDHFCVSPPLKLEAKAGAGHVYYEFERKPATILKP